MDHKTFYTIHGDIFAWFCIFISAGGVLLSAIRRRVWPIRAEAAG